MSDWALPIIGRILHGGFGEGQAGYYAAGLFVSAWLLSIWRVLRAEPLTGEHNAACLSSAMRGHSSAAPNGLLKLTRVASE